MSDEYVKLSDVMQAIEVAAEQPPSSRSGTLSFAIDSILALDRVSKQGETAAGSQKPYTSIPEDRWGVHEGHCCLEHGCKYNDHDCPVALGLTRQDGGCETCGLEESGYYDEPEDRGSRYMIAKLKEGFREIARHDDGNRYSFREVSELCQYYLEMAPPFENKPSTGPLQDVACAVSDVLWGGELGWDSPTAQEGCKRLVGAFREWAKESGERKKELESLRDDFEKITARVRRARNGAKKGSSTRKAMGRVMELIEEMGHDPDSEPARPCCPKGPPGEPGLPGISYEQMFRDSMMYLSEIVYQTACEKGWWPTEDTDPEIKLVSKCNLPKDLKERLVQMLTLRNDGEMIALMHSELSEALEALRLGNPPDDKLPDFPGTAAELADVLIRMMDYCHTRNLDLAGAVLAKMEVNKGREYKHGGKEF
jgi:NTP pyrophosphatase (non-canonical NTP hydrolase)